MTLIELYKSQSEDGKNGENSRVLLTQMHWFTVNSDFDPKTGEALPQALSAFLAKVTRSSSAEILHDRLWRITEHARLSVERLFRSLIKSPRREQALMHVSAVRELDASSFVKLSNRPGRNIREKLAGRPYLQAVRRFQSVDLPENRLLKVFVTHLAELLELRHDYLGEEEDELLPKIQSWLLSDEAHAIAQWDNLTPNNTLLSHRDYRRVWDAWRWLQTLDDDIARDFSRLKSRTQTMSLWNKYGRMYSDRTHLFAEMPVLFDYEKYEIHPWLSHLEFQKVTRKIARSTDKKTISEPVCVDLGILRPYFANTEASAESLSETYLWQNWKNNDESIDIDLFNSDAAYLHTDAITISSTDLFFSKDNTPEHLDRASRTFAFRLREIFKNNTLIWLVPDFLNDFELEITRRNLNARFPNAEPLPRSVAAVFEQVDYSKIKNEGFPIVVVDTIGGKTCVTKVIARFDPEIRKRLPETNGFYWERCPPVIILHGTAERVEDEKCQNYDIITVDVKGQWHDRIQTENPQFINTKILKSDPRIGQFAFCINLAESPVVGAIRLHALQQSAGDIPLWRDHIPELSIKAWMDGLYQRFFLVGKDTTVCPVRGETVPIVIKALFPLPAAKQFFSFPLYQGENADEIGFSARLDSPAFPLKTKAVCKLNLTFEYGADEPYKLIFEPLDKSFPPVRATWQRTVEKIITDAPAPKYPEPMKWVDLRRVLKPDSQETSDLLEWVLSEIDRLDSKLFIRPRKRTEGKLSSYWRKDIKGDHYAFAQCDNINASVFIHENNFMEGLDYEDFRVGDKVSFELREREGKFFGYSVANANYINRTKLRKLNENATTDLVKRIRKSLYVPFILVWREGRSILDTNCPKDFANKAKNKISYLTDLLTKTEIPQPIKSELIFLLSCLHKDTTDDCVQWITRQVEDNNIRDPQAVGFSLGNVSEEWQKYVFSSLVQKPDVPTIRAFAYAIWREKHFVERFSISELKATLNALSIRLASITSVKPNGDEMKDKQIVRDWIRATTETLELLLGLLRTRASTIFEIKMLLQPHQKITKELAEQVEQVTEIVAKSDINLFSRVQLNIQKPVGDRTPDLLYALRLYLTGDDGANAIHITSISDNDDERTT